MVNKNQTPGTLAAHLANLPIRNEADALHAPVATVQTPPAPWLAGNPIAKAFGKPSFVLGDRKVWPDKKQPGRRNATMATFPLPLAGGIGSVTAHIYMNETLEEDAEGKFWQGEYTCSLPKAVVLSESVDDDAQRSYKIAVLALYQAWSETVDMTTTAVTGRSAQPRLVGKRTPVAK